MRSLSWFPVSIAMPLVVLAPLVLAFDCSFSDEYPRQYVSYKTETPPVIDGHVLNDPVWEEVPFTEDFIDISTSVVPRFKTRAKIRWDDSFLYVAGYLEEPQVWATLTQHDSVIFQDNDFEFFCNPDGTTHFYKEWEMNAFNTTWDLCLNQPYLNGGYENSSRVFPEHGFDMKHVRSAVYVDGEINDPATTTVSWSTEIAYNLSELAFNETSVSLPPSNGDYWRFQFSRVEWHVEVNGSSYQKVPDKPCDNWVYTSMGVIDVHLPEKWAYLQFSTAAVNSTAPVRDPEWTVRSVAMQLYYAQVAHFKVHGAYTDSLLTLMNLAPLGPDVFSCSSPPTISLNTNASTFTAKVPSHDRSMTAVIQNDRYLTVSHQSN